jgi:hypothetical protein
LLLQRSLQHELPQQISPQQPFVAQPLFFRQLHSNRNPGMQIISGWTFQQCFLTASVTFLGQQTGSQQQLSQPPLLPLEQQRSPSQHPAGVTKLSCSAATRDSVR